MSNTVRTLSLLALFVLVLSTTAQTPPAVLTIDGVVEHPLKLTASDLAKVPHVIVQAKGHDGKEAAYDGIALSELLKMAGVPSGEKLRGKVLANYLLVEASDGYRAVFALPEVDSGFNDRVIILAHKRNGQPLAATEGSWRIVVPGEKREARWVRQVTAIHIKQSP